MQKFLRTLALMALMLVPWVTQAQTLTVADGTETHQYVPFYGYYADADQQNQMIYPATDLSAMVGKEITQMVFYYSSVGYGSGVGNWTVSLGETSATSLSGLDNTTALTQVFSGDLDALFDATGQTLTITFDDGYTYNGGNLLVDFSHSASSYKDYFFYGVSATGASYTYGSQRDFLPKVTFTYETPATCAKPTGLAVNYAGGTEATISWTSEATAWNISVNGVETAITTNPYTLTNLSLSTTYEVMVQADCGSNGTSNWTNAISFTTPDCWGGHLISYTLADQYGDGWNGAAILVKDACGNVVETITMDNGSSSSGSLGLCGEYYEFVWQTGSYDSECSFTFTEGGSTLFSGTGSLPYTLGTISCPAPTDLATDELTTSSATLSWTENGTATAWQLCVNGDEDHLIDVTTNPYTLIGLAENTPYTVKLRANCGEKQSCWTEDINFTTLANCQAPVLEASGITNVTAHTADVAWTGYNNDSYNIRYQVSNSISEGFENGIPEGWTVNKTNSSTGVDASATHNGSYGFRFQWSEQNASLVSPVLSGTENGVTFSFYYRRYNTSYTEGFRVGYNTDGSDVFTYGDEISSTNMDWLRYETSFPAGTKRVAIQYVYHNAYYLYIDDIEILIPSDDWTNTTANTNSKTLDGLNGETTYLVQVQGICGSNVSGWSDGVHFTTEIACPAPTGLALSNPTTSSVDLAWTENGSATAWQICLNDDETNLVDANTNPFTLTGLDEYTEYTIKVLANCGVTDGVSVWSNEETIRTLAGCQAVQELAVTALTATEATISWTDPNDGTNTYTITKNGEVVSSSWSGTSYSFTELTAQTDYVFTVAVNCASATSVDASLNVTTSCEAISTFPITYGFESSEGFSGSTSNFTTNTLGDCWRNEATVQNGSYGDRLWSVNSTTSSVHTGSQSLKLADKGNSTNFAKTMLVFPPMNFTATNGYIVSFWINRNATGTNPEGFKVYASNTDTISNTAVYLGHYSRNYNIAYPQVESGTGWYQYETEPITLTGNVYLIFEGQSYYGNATYVDDVEINVAPTCVKVSNLVVSDKTSNSITLDWDDNYNTGATYTIYNNEDNSVVISGLDVTNYTIGSLSSNTAYSFSVVANCSPEDASEAATISDRTDCDLLSLPWTCGFEADEIQSTVAATALPWCSYRNVEAVSYPNHPYSYTTNVHSGSRSLYYYSATSVSYPEVMAFILPQVDVASFPMDGNRVTFWARMAAAANTKAVKAYTLTDPTDWSTATYVDEVTVSGATYEKYTIALTNATANEAYVALAVERGTGALYLDDLTLEVIPSCMDVTDVTVDEVTGTTVTLSWTDANNTDVKYTIYNMADQSVVESNIAGTTYTVQNLEGNTAYTFGVQANCPNGDSPIETVSTRTACVAISTLPYTCGFETDEIIATTNAQALPYCWTRINDATGSYTYYPYGSTSNPHSGSRSFYFYCYTSASYPTNQVAVLPQIDIASLPLSTLRLTFYGRGSSSYGGTLSVGTMSDPNDLSTFTEVQSLSIPSASAYPAEPYMVVGFPNNGDQYIAIRMVKGSSTQAVYIDDLTLDLKPRMITNLAATDITANSVTLTWEDIDADNTTTYTVSYDNSSYNDVTGTSYTVSGLAPNTSYTFTVVPNGPNAEASHVTAITLQMPAELPYTNNFDNASENSQWTMVNDATNGWYIGSATGNDGNGLYISNDGGNTYAYSNNVVQWSYAYRMFNLAAAGWYKFSFDWMAQGESTWDYMRAWLAPVATVNLTSGKTPVGTSVSTNVYNTTPETPDGWIDLNPNSGKLNLMSNWQSAEKLAEIVDPGAYAIVFMWANDGSSGNNPPAAIDNIVVKAKTAFAPTTLTAENITATGATLTWEADDRNNGTETYSVMLNDQALSAETTPAAVVSGTTATITGMTANTDYVFGVKALNLGDESEAKPVFMHVNEYPTEEPGKMVSLNYSYSWSNTANPSVSFYYGMGATRATEAAVTRNQNSGSNLTFTNTESNDWVNDGPVTVVFLNHNANAIGFSANYPQVSYVCPAVDEHAAEEAVANATYTWAIADANFSETYTNHAEGTLVNDAIEYTVIPDAAYRTYEHVVKNVADCDSVRYTLNLTLNPDYIIEVAGEICERETYTVTDGTTTEEFTATTNTVVTLHSVTGADSVINLSLQMHPAPVATINSRTENTINDYCEGKALELVAGSNMTGVSYVWNNDDQLTDGTITVEPADATNVYTLVATDNTYNCASLPATLTVNTTPVPALSISGDAEVCAGQSVTLTVSDANNVPATYRWSNGQTGTSITVTPAQTTTYTVTATTETTNCQVTAEHTVTVNALPVVELSTSTTALCSGSALTLTATENANYSYSWNTGANTAVVELNPTVGGAYTLTVTDQNNCVNEFTTANITVYPVYDVNAERSACQEMLPITWGDNTITGEGEYDYTFTSVNGCDSTVHLTFSIEAMPTENSFAEYCEGAEFNWGGTVYTATAELAEVSYIDNSNTCPVNKVQHLTVYPVKATTVPMTVCDAYTWNLTGDEYTQSGDYQKTLATVHGCDSVVTLALTVNYKNEGIDQQASCDQYTWIDGVTYTESNNTATFTLEGANVYGCDSTVTLNLTVNYTTYGTDFHCVTTDRSFTWIDGVTYNTSIAPDANITKKLDEPNAAGCDSIAVLSLVLNPVTDTLPWVNRTECDNFFLDVVTFNDETCESSIVREYISESGQVERRTRNAETGRDQWTRINLTIRNSEHKTVRLSECVPYIWYPQDGNTALWHEITSDTILSQEVQNEFGCSTIKVLRFTAKYPTEVTVTDAICQGTAEYSIREWSTVTSNLEAGEYEYTVPTTTKNAAGCPIDSTLVLTVNPIYNVDDEPVLCESQFTNNAYTYVNPNNAEESVELHIMALNGQPYSGTESAYWTTAAGCDSLVTINYTVNPTLNVNLVVGVCEPYTWDANGHEFTEFGDYTDQVTNMSEAYGCDSITTLNLSYYDKAYGIEEVIECGSFTYKGVTYRDGYVDDSVASGQSVITGCDSVTVFRHVIKQRQLVDQYVLTNKDYQWINGRTYTESVDGIYYVASAANECDSVVVLHLTMAEPIVICENEMPFTTQYGFDINPVLGEGNYNGVYERTNGRGNDTVMYYTVNRNTAETVTVNNVCDSYTWTTGNGQSYDEDGNYDWITTNLNGCDSTVTLALTLNHSNAGTTSDEACGEYTWTVNSYNTTSGQYEDVVVNSTAYTESGEYTYTATNGQGCDSVITLTLTINPVYNITEDIVACDSYEWKDGDATIGTYTESTVANHTFTTINGCDSVVTLNITINNSVVKEDEYIENRGSYTYNNVLYVAPYDGYIETLVEGGAANHCDSTHRLHLIVNNSTLYEEVVVNCGDYTWRNGKTYTWVPAGERVNPIINYKERTADGTLVDVYEYPEFNTYKTDGSIDSTYILQLTLQEAYVEYRTVDVLMSRLDNDGNIEIENHVFNFAAQKAAKQDVNGLLDTLNKDDYAISSYYCDSIIYYTFNLKYNYDTVDAIQYYCYGDAAAAGKTVDEIFYVDNVENEGTPQEMVMTTKCIRNRELVDNVALTACDSIEWNGAWRTGDDTYQTTKVINGITCDSVVNLTLTVINTVHNVNTEVKCQSELATFTWNGKSGYTESVVDTFKYQLPATGECWNVDTLKLTVKESFTVTTDSTRCDEFVWNGTTYTTSGEISQGFTAVNGCDSTVTINLTINNSFNNETAPFDTTVFGDNFRLNGQLFSAPYDGTVNFNLTTVNGCDSIAYFHVVLNHYQIVPVMVTGVCGEYTWENALADDNEYVGNGHVYRSITDEEAAGGALYRDVTENAMVFSNPLDTNEQTGKIYSLQLTINGAVFATDAVEFLVSRGTLVIDADHSFDYTALQQTFAGTKVVNETLHYNVIGACDSIVDLTVTLVNNYDTLDDVYVCNDQTTFEWTEANVTLDLTNVGENNFTETLYAGTDDEMVTTRTIIRRAAITGTQTLTGCDSTEWNNTWYFAGVVYEPVTLTSVLTGCDSVVTLTNNITTTVHNVTELTECDTYTWTAGNGETYTASTVGEWSRANADNAQCFDVDTLKLTINVKSNGVDEQHGCDSYTWAHNGETYTADENEANVTLTGANMYGCDSIVTLNLTMGYSNSYDSTLWVSDGSYRYQKQDGTYEMLGLGEHFFVENYTNVSGCDSALNLTIKVGNGYFKAIDTIACDHFTWINGITYQWISAEESAEHNNALYKTTDGEYITSNPYFNKKNVDDNGVTIDFDSIFMLRLTLNQNVESEDVVNFPVSMGVFTYGNLTHDYTLTYGIDKAPVFEGIEDHYDVHFNNPHYCDSIVHVTVNVYNNFVADPTVDLCAGVETYTAFNQTITLNYEDYDSLYTYYIYDAIDDNNEVHYVTVVQHPISYTTERRVECDSYIWNGRPYTESTSGATVNLKDRFGCDSTVTLTLTIYRNTNTVTGTVAEPVESCESYLWTLANGETYTLTESGAYGKAYTASAEGNCPSVDSVYLVINHSSPETTLDNVEVCDTYTWEVNTFNGTEYETVVAGVYTANTAAQETRVYEDVTYTAKNQYGCDSVITIPMITVKSSKSSDATETVCDEFVWNNAATGEEEHYYTSNSALELHTLTVEGCDSTVNMNLNVVKSGQTLDPVTACDSYEWNELTLTESGQYYKVTPTNNICQTFTDTLNLTVNYGSYNAETVVTCNSYTWINGVTYDEPGTITVVYDHNGEPNAAGCPQVDTLHLTIGEGLVIKVDSAIACLPYTWVVNDSVIGTYSESIETSVRMPNSLTGCDSIVYLVLTVVEKPEAYEEDTICASELPYTWRGQILEEAGKAEYISHFDETCDSVYHFTLTVNPTYDIQLTADVCLGQGYNENNFNITAEELPAAGVYTFTQNLTSISGCDSIVTLTVTVGDVIEHLDEVTACDSYEWTPGNGETYTYDESGNHEVTYTNAGGCVSIDKLQLTINNSQNIALEPITACDSYEWNGVTYTESGELIYTTTGANGCDSTTTLSLTVNNSQTIALDAVTACDSYEWNGETYTESAELIYTTTGANNCDSTTTLSLTINNSQTIAVDPVDACDSYEWNGVTYTESGEYSYTTTGANGCDSTTTLALTIKNSVNTEFSDSECLFYVWNSQAYTESGDYEQTFEAANGCDSIVTLHLTINQPVTAEITETACDSYDWNNASYSTSGDYQQTFTAANGCDSIVTLHLTVVNHIDAEVSATACGSYIWVDNNNTEYTESGDYTRDITDVNNCAAIETLHLTIIEQPVDVTVTETVCDEYLWDVTGEVYTESGVYTHELNNQGCVATATLNLTVNESVTETINVTACGSYTWNDVTYTESTIVSYEGETGAGCDSIVTLVLTINNPVYNTVYETACNSYTWSNGDGMTYTESGSYLYTIEQGAANGCDSIVTLNLTVNNAQTVALDAIAACDSYEWNGVTYTEGGELSFTTTGANGCDSTTTVVLTINNSQVVALDPVATCNSYEWNGNVYTESGELSYTTQDVNGCDSTTTLSLTISGAIYSIDEQNACDSYTWIVNDEVIGTYTASTNEPTVILPAASGCDSIVTLNLTIRNSSNGVFEATACDSYTWALNGVTYTESNNSDVVTLVNVAGCDSTVTLNLTVNHSTEGEINIEAYDYYTWYGVTYTETPAEAPTHMFTNAAGCDSTLILNLTILHYDSITVILSVNDPVMGTTNPVAGTYRFYPGESVSATATPNGGYLFTGWVVNGDTASLANDVYIDVLPEMAGMTFNVVATFKADNVGIESVDYSNISIYSVDNNVVVKGAEGLTIYFYDVNGRCIERRANAAEIENFTVETSGVFLVKAGNAPAKRIVVIR